MANHKSAKKRIRTSESRRMFNKMKTSRVRTEVKKLRTLIAAGNKEDAQRQFPVVQGLISKLAKSSAMKKATAGRKTSRLAAQIAKL